MKRNTALLQNTENREIQFEPNIRTIAKIDNLIAAYELIKSNPGNMTRGTDNTTLDGIDLDYFIKIHEQLRAGKYTFPPARRVAEQIPKPGKEETRPLTIASPRDKIVQKAIQLVLNELYEKRFLDSSHGFRPGRGTHTAIRSVDAKFQSVHYIIEADFSKAFDKIPHDKLMEVLKRDIKCLKTLKLIESGLKAGLLENGVLHENFCGKKFRGGHENFFSHLGTPQGSVLSPLLSNVYFHELDLYMEDLMNRYRHGTKRPSNKEYTKLQNRAKYMRLKGLEKTPSPQEYNEVLRKLTNTPSTAHNDSFTRVHYVRYADDFIIGVEGSYEMAVEILNRVQSFLETLNLKLNESKTKITKFNTKPIELLGYKIMAPYRPTEGGPPPYETTREPKRGSGRTITRRKKLRIRTYMDYEKVTSRMAANGLICKRVRPGAASKLVWRGTFRGNLVNLDHADILQYYSSIIRGIYNYYCFVANMNQVAKVIWLITESCAQTLARKYKVKSLKKVFHKF
jgi:group II intron reverse transcriptase/maturase